MGKGAATGHWLATIGFSILLGATTPSVAAEGGFAGPSKDSNSQEAATGHTAEQAMSIVAEAERTLAAAQEAVASASNEVAEREAAKRAADRKADQAIADATLRLTPNAATSGKAAEKDEAEKLRGDIARAIHASDAAGRALTKARAALASAEEAATEEARRLITEVEAVSRTATKQVTALDADARRSAGQVAAAVDVVEKAEAARRAAEAEVERVRGFALEAINKAAGARRALAAAQATEAAIAQGLQRLVTESEKLNTSEGADSDPSSVPGQ